jgi:hypothetical protein
LELPNVVVPPLLFVMSEFAAVAAPKNKVAAEKVVASEVVILAEPAELLPVKKVLLGPVFKIVALAALL